MSTTYLFRPALAAVLLVVSGCAVAQTPEAATNEPSPSVAISSPPSPSSASSASASPTAAPIAPAPETLIAAGDIASCASNGDEATAALLDAIEGTVATLGDNAYPSGTTEQFAACYAPSWGRHRDRTRPSPGNHDYETPGAAGYFAYFGDAAGAPGESWYSYDLGAWHLISLDSNCELVGGCHVGSPQHVWLTADLAASDAECTLAYWHHPRFSSPGIHGSDTRLTDLWQALHEAGADVVLSGHDHHYERFAPQDATGTADPERGIREFVVGTGGESIRDANGSAPNSEVYADHTFGVLVLTLHQSEYSWQFIATDGAVADDGEAACH